MKEVREYKMARFDDKTLGNFLGTVLAPAPQLPEGHDMGEKSVDGFPLMQYRGWTPVHFESDGRESRPPMPEDMIQTPAAPGPYVASGQVPAAPEQYAGSRVRLHRL
jgi:hypothetical protein